MKTLTWTTLRLSPVKFYTPADKFHTTAVLGALVYPIREVLNGIQGIFAHLKLFTFAGS